MAARLRRTATSLYAFPTDSFEELSAIYRRSIAAGLYPSRREYRDAGSGNAAVGEVGCEGVWSNSKHGDGTYRWYMRIETHYFIQRTNVQSFIDNDNRHPSIASSRREYG